MAEEAQRDYLLQRYRGMGDEELIETKARELTDAAADAINQVISERGISSDKQKTIIEHIAEERSTENELYGVRGWLGLLVISMMFIGPLMSAGSIASNLGMAEYRFPHLVTSLEWGTYKTSIWGTFLFVAGLHFYGGLGLARDRRWSVVTRAKRILWVTGPLASIFMGLVLPRIIFGDGWSVTTEVIGGFTGGFIVAVIWAAIWSVYLSKSRRVRNTYGGT